MSTTPTPDDHIDAVRLALPFVALAGRRDADAFALALRQRVETPEEAGKLVYGLVELVLFVMGMPAVVGEVRLQLLEEMLLGLAKDGG